MVRTARGRTARLAAILAALLVPVAVLGVLSWVLDAPGERSGMAKAAVVNLDEPVRLNGQLAPLGRQLTGKLAGEQIAGNYRWEVASEQSAADGMRDGSYLATVVIPKGFSRAATSYARDPAQAQRARVEVTTSERGNRLDEVISKQVTTSAAQLLGRDLSTRYLDNIYLGFNRLHEQLGKADDGAGSLAGGAKRLSGGTDRLSSAAEQLAGGNRELADGLGGLRGGVDRLASGAGELSGGLDRLRDSTVEIPGQVNTLSEVADRQSTGTKELAGGLGKLAGGMRQLAEQCPPTAGQLCDAIRLQADAAGQLDDGAGKLTRAGDGVATGLRGLAGKTPSARGGLPALTGGIDRLADGAAKLTSGAQRLRDGSAQTANGANSLTDGARALAKGTGGLGDGARKLSGGTRDLSGGLEQAVRKLPRYAADEREKLSGVVAEPIQASASTGTGSGSDTATGGLSAGATALYAVLALWLGALGTFLVLRATPRHTLESTRPTFLLAMRGVRLPMLLAVLQGALVTVLLGVSRTLSVPEWFGVGGLVLLVAVTCTALNQALVAALPTLGRFVALLVALVLLAVGFTAAAPPVLTEVAGLLPVGPAVDGLRVLLGGAGVSSGAVAALVFWGVAGVVVCCLVVQRGRMVRLG